jgi:hypothetical protein
LRAAEAALRREWAEIKEEVLRANRAIEDEDEKAEAAARRMQELLTGFVERHRKTLRVLGADPALLDPAGLTERFQKFIDAEREYRQAEDALLIATANKAEGQQAVNILLLQKLEEWEALPDSAWDAMSPDERRQDYELLEQLRARCDEILAELPLQLRQEWERRLGLS